MLPPPARPLIVSGLFTLRKGARLHRIGNHDFPENSFNPCAGRPTRFAPVYDDLRRCVPTLYAGQNFNCVVFETIFHDVPVKALIKSVRIQELEGKAYAVLAVRRPLILAKLFAPDLLRWNLKRTELIDTSPAKYKQTARYVEAIHNDNPRLDGVVWTSRKFDPLKGYLLFGDRIDSNELEIIMPAEELLTSRRLIRRIRRLGLQSGITITT